MAFRATETEVKEIIDTNLMEEQVSPFLKVANQMVTDLVSDVGYASGTLREIERWLAAHFVAVRDPRVAKEKIGDAQADYHGKSDMALNFTPYGQQVMVLEYKGKIAAAMKAMRPAEIKAIA